MTDFADVDLRGSTFRDVDLRDARLRHVDLSGADLRAVGFHRVRMRGVELAHVDISGELVDVVVNGVDIAPLVDAELDRRYPERAQMRPTDAAGFRAAWDTVERLWAGTVEHARSFEPALLHESVDGEWSFIETLRHLSFASAAWVDRAVLGEPTPWHPLDLPWDDAPDDAGYPRDREARPSLDEVLELRRGRMATVRTVVAGLTDDSLDRQTEPLAAPGWPPPGETFPVRECLLVLLNEEWEHRLYAERDLAVLDTRGGQATPSN